MVDVAETKFDVYVCSTINSQMCIIESLLDESIELGVGNDTLGINEIEMLNDIKNKITKLRERIDDVITDAIDI